MKGGIYEANNLFRFKITIDCEEVFAKKVHVTHYTSYMGRPWYEQKNRKKVLKIYKNNSGGRFIKINGKRFYI
jgi:hypothetical protein